MTVYFTSNVHHGDTISLLEGRTPEYDTRTNDAGEIEHVISIPNVGEFDSTNLTELRNLFARIAGTIDISIWRQGQSRGNSGSH